MITALLNKSGLHIVSRKETVPPGRAGSGASSGVRWAEQSRAGSAQSAYNLSPVERAEAKAFYDAYQLVMLITNTPFISAEGLEIAVRVQKHLCEEYNRILLKGWVLK